MFGTQISLTGSKNQLTGEGLDVLQSLASTSLQLDGAARAAASKGEGEGLANLNLEGKVGEGGLGKSNGGKGRDGSDRVLHLESVKGRLIKEQSLNERRRESF